MAVPLSICFSPPRSLSLLFLLFFRSVLFFPLLFFPSQFSLHLPCTGSLRPHTGITEQVVNSTTRAPSRALWPRSSASTRLAAGPGPAREVLSGPPKTISSCPEHPRFTHYNTLAPLPLSFCPVQPHPLPKPFGSLPHSLSPSLHPSCTHSHCDCRTESHWSTV